MIWDVATHRLRDQVQVGSNIFGFSITHDGRELALAEQVPVIEILDLEKPHEPRRALRAASDRVVAVAFSPDGRNARNGRLWRQGRTARRPERPDPRRVRRPGQSCRRSRWPSGREETRWRWPSVMRSTWSAWRRSLDGATIAASLGPILRLAVSPDERLLALGREDGTIVVWDVQAKRVLQTLSGHGLAVFGVAFVPGPAARGWFRWAGTA